MFRSTLPFLLLLLLGSASAGVLFANNPDGTFTNNGYGSSSETVHSDRAQENYEGTTKPPLDDADLVLIHEYFPDQKVSQNGNLRYSDLPLVEKTLKKDIFMLIAKNEDYMAFLSHPSHKDLFVMINDMIQGPNQKVLQEQIWKKVLAIEAYYKKVFEPLKRRDTIETAMKLLMRLEKASGDGELTVEDTVQLDQNLGTIAFLLNQNLTKRLVTMLENNLHPVPLEHKRSHHVRKSAVSETPTGVPSSNQAKNFVNVSPSSLGRMENITDIADPTIYNEPRTPMPFNNNHGSKVNVSEVKSSENHVENNDVNVTNDRKSFDDVLDRPRNFPFGDEVEKFLTGDSEMNSSNQPMPFTHNNGTTVDVSKVNSSEHPIVKDASKFNKDQNVSFADETQKFVSGNSENDNVSSAVHSAVGFSYQIQPSSEDLPKKNVSSVNNNQKSSDNVLDRPRNFPFNDEIQKFVSGDSEEDTVPSTGNPHRSSVQTTTSELSTLTETRKTKGNHFWHETTTNSQNRLSETTTMAPATTGMRGTRSP